MPADRLVVRGLRSVMIFSLDPATSCAWWAELLGAVVHEDGEFRWLDLPAVELVIRAGGSLHRGPLPVSAGRTIAQVRDPFGAVLAWTAVPDAHPSEFRKTP